MVHKIINKTLAITTKNVCVWIFIISSNKTTVDLKSFIMFHQVNFLNKAVFCFRRPANSKYNMAAMYMTGTFIMVFIRFLRDQNIHVGLDTQMRLIHCLQAELELIGDLIRHRPF